MDQCQIKEPTAGSAMHRNRPVKFQVRVEVWLHSDLVLDAVNCGLAVLHGTDVEVAQATMQIALSPVLRLAHYDWLRDR